MVVGGERDLIRTRGGIRVANIMNAITRVAQPKPILGWRWVKIMGYMMPPAVSLESSYYQTWKDHIPRALPAEDAPIASAVLA